MSARKKRSSRDNPKNAGRPVYTNLAALRASADDSSGLAGIDANLTYILGDPLRIRILAALNEVDAAPSDLARALNCTIKQSDYHVKILVEHDYAMLVKTEPTASGLPKKIYRATKKVELPIEVIEALPQAIRETVAATIFMTSLADAQVALMSGTLTSRPESHATWTRFRVTERTWKKSVKVVDRAFERVRKIAAEEELRRKNGEFDSDEDPPLLMSLNMAAFILPSNGGDLMTHDEDYLRHQPDEE